MQIGSQGLLLERSCAFISRFNHPLGVNHRVSLVSVTSICLANI